MLRILLALMFVVITSSIAIAQMIPEKCKNLDVDDFVLDKDANNNNLYVNASVHNNSSYNLLYATFSFDLLIDGNVKVGETSQSIGRLLPTEIWKIRMNTSVKEIKYIRLATVSCNFSN